MIITARRTLDLSTYIQHMYVIQQSTKFKQVSVQGLVTVQYY